MQRTIVRTQRGLVLFFLERSPPFVTVMVGRAFLSGSSRVVLFSSENAPALLGSATLQMQCCLLLRLCCGESGIRSPRVLPSERCVVIMASGPESPWTLWIGSLWDYADLLARVAAMAVDAGLQRVTWATWCLLAFASERCVLSPFPRFSGERDLKPTLFFRDGVSCAPRVYVLSRPWPTPSC